MSELLPSESEVANNCHGSIAAKTMTGYGTPSLGDRKSTRLNSSHSQISYAVFCLKKQTALKIAKLKGGRVILTSSSDAKLREAQTLAADVTLNHTILKISHEVFARNDKAGAYVVI